MKAKRYRPQPSRRVYIPKDEHTQRPLGLPSLEDKIVQKGIATILEAIYEQDFLDGSQPGRAGTIQGSSGGPAPRPPGFIALQLKAGEGQNPMASFADISSSLPGG